MHCEMTQRARQADRQAVATRAQDCVSSTDLGGTPAPPLPEQLKDGLTFSGSRKGYLNRGVRPVLIELEKN